MKKIIGVVALILALSMGVMVTSAQDTLTLGEAIIGNLSPETTQVEYTYTATEGEILVIELLAVDFSVFSDLQIIVNDPSGVELFRDETFGVGASYLQATEDGEYTIIAARGEYAAEDGAGEYYLRLLNPTELVAGEPVTQDKKQGETFYYMYSADADVNLTFVRDGSIPLSVTVNEFSEYSAGDLSTLATLAGSFLTRGSLGVIPGGETYIVIVAEELFFFGSDSDMSTFVLGLEAN
jgi:hypothetical protein